MINHLWLAKVFNFCSARILASLIGVFLAERRIAKHAGLYLNMIVRLNNEFSVIRTVNGAIWKYVEEY